MTRERLERLASSKSEVERRQAAGDTGCPPELLVKLAQDEDDAIRAAAREQLEQRRREATCSDYATELKVSGTGYGGEL